MVTVSVAMATYNGSRFLQVQLDSLSRQTVLPKELIVCDDNSTDDTIAIIQSYAAVAPFPVHLHRNEERLGYRSNFMKSAGLCRGDVIAFCDQDDIWDPHKIELVTESFADPEILLVYHNARIVRANGDPYDLKFNDAGGDRTIDALSLPPWHFPLGFSQSFRSVLLDFSELRTQSVDFYNTVEPFAHDQWINFLGSSLGRRLYIDQPLVDYRQHDMNTFGIIDHPAAKTMMGKIKKRISKKIDFAVLGLSCYKMAYILTLIEKGPINLGIREHAARAAVHYYKVADIFAGRTDVYLSRSVSERARSWMRLLREGAYGPSMPWPIGRKQIVADLARGVMLARFQIVDSPAPFDIDEARRNRG